MSEELNEQFYNDWIQQVTYFQQLMQTLEGNLQKITSLKVELAELEKLNGDEKILAPIANGIFIEAKLESVKTLKVNVGKGLVVDKTVPETISLLEKQEEEILLSKEQVTLKLEELYSIAQ